jgi:hypothetical protein
LPIFVLLLYAIAGPLGTDLEQQCNRFINVISFFHLFLVRPKFAALRGRQTFFEFLL